MSLEKQKSLAFGDYFQKYLPPEEESDKPAVVTSKTSRRRRNVKIVEENTEIEPENETNEAGTTDPEIQNVKQKLMKGDALNSHDTDYLLAAVEELKIEQEKAYQNKQYTLYRRIDEAISVATYFYSQVQKTRFKKDYETRYAERASNAEKELQQLEDNRASERKKLIKSLKELFTILLSLGESFLVLFIEIILFPDLFCFLIK